MSEQADLYDKFTDAIDAEIARRENVAASLTHLSAKASQIEGKYAAIFSAAQHYFDFIREQELQPIDGRSQEIRMECVKLAMSKCSKDWNVIDTLGFANGLASYVLKGELLVSIAPVGVK